MGNYTFDGLFKILCMGRTSRFVLATNACCKGEAYEKFLDIIVEGFGLTLQSLQIYFDENPNDYKIERRWKR